MLKWDKKKQQEKINSKKKKQETGFANPENPTKILKDVFKYRTSKHRTLKRLKDALPQTPKRRSATLAAYLKFPTTKLLINADMIILPEEQNEKSTQKAVMRDLKKPTINICKMKRSKDSVTSMNILVASISGEQVTKSKCRKSLAKTLG